MARIFWDTNLFIYLFERNAEWSDRVLDLTRKMDRRGDQLVTSWLTVGEILTKPSQQSDEITLKRYLNFFKSAAVETVVFGADAAVAYAALRSRERVKPADGMQLACAAAAKTDLFITNDSRLSNAKVPGITFIAGLAQIPY